MKANHNQRKIPFADLELSELYSKKIMKANHNCRCAKKHASATVGTLLKENHESKPQLRGLLQKLLINCRNSTQRKS